jgi:hypothetical protein
MERKMYSLVSTIGIRKGIYRRWENISGQVKVADLYANFRKVQLTLLAEGASAAGYLDLDDISSSYSTYQGTVSQLLTSIGNASLPVKEEGIVLKQSSVRYMDSVMAGYRVDPVDSALRKDPNKPISQRPNLLLSSDRLNNYDFMHRRSLVSVNGHYHLTDTDGVSGLLIKDATKSQVISGQGAVGILSFSSIADVEQIPITQEMLQDSDPETILVHLPSTVVGKSVFFIIGGYMVFVDNMTARRVGESSYKIDFTKYNVVERYYEMKKYLDVGPLGIETSINNNDVVGLAELTASDTMRNWFKLSQTFAVVVDCPELYIQTKMIQRSGLPGKYHSYEVPKLPIVLELGRHPSYWYNKEYEQYSISMIDNLIDNELYYTTPSPKWININGANTSGNPTHVSKAYFLEIGRDY